MTPLAVQKDTETNRIAMTKDVVGPPVITAADLDAMTPQQIEQAWRASIVTNRDVLPEEYAEALSRRAAARLERLEIRPQD